MFIIENTSVITTNCATCNNVTSDKCPRLKYKKVVSNTVSKCNMNALSTVLVLQSIIAKHVDCNRLAAMARLELSSAFGIINIKLLIKRLTIIGLLDDANILIEVWLS
jgi:hypothetical protein